MKTPLVSCLLLAAAAGCVELPPPLGPQDGFDVASDAKPDADVAADAEPDADVASTDLAETFDDGGEVGSDSETADVETLPAPEAPEVTSPYMESAGGDLPQLIDDAVLLTPAYDGFTGTLGQPGDRDAMAFNPTTLERWVFTVRATGDAGVFGISAGLKGPVSNLIDSTAELTSNGVARISLPSPAELFQVQVFEAQDGGGAGYTYEVSVTREPFVAVELGELTGSTLSSPEPIAIPALGDAVAVHFRAAWDEGAPLAVTVSPTGSADSDLFAVAVGSVDSGSNPSEFLRWREKTASGAEPIAVEQADFLPCTASKCVVGQVYDWYVIVGDHLGRGGPGLGFDVLVSRPRR